MINYISYYQIIFNKFFKRIFFKNSNKNYFNFLLIIKIMKKKVINLINIILKII